ncbi:hypothetical protein SDC9_171716 [bioreactor metagenome]|uniref:Uncharacterized protein n=1 Tax=bioreactor metagenome TaxID=1076179 RepID=A0A645GEW2_9ZZZZ
MLGHVLDHADIGCEQQHIHREVGRQRASHHGGRVRCHGVCRPEQAIDQVGLAPDLRHVPAGQRGHPARERHADQGEQERAGQGGRVQRAAAVEHEGGPPGDGQHQQAQPHHHPVHGHRHDEQQQHRGIRNRPVHQAVHQRPERRDDAQRGERLQQQRRRTHHQRQRCGHRRHRHAPQKRSAPTDLGAAPGAPKI